MSLLGPVGYLDSLQVSHSTTEERGGVDGGCSPIPKETTGQSACAPLQHSSILSLAKMSAEKGNLSGHRTWKTRETADKGELEVAGSRELRGELTGLLGSWKVDEGTPLTGESTGEAKRTNRRHSSATRSPSQLLHSQRGKAFDSYRPLDWRAVVVCGGELERGLWTAFISP